MIMVYRTLIATFFLALGLASLPATPAAAAEARCFPETGQCISGRLRQFWEQNGGLSVFGYPITAVYEQPGSGISDVEHPPAVYLAQRFERVRLELHPESAAPYQVLLGRLGDERLRATGVDWQALPRESGALPGCIWFEQTGHNICDQAAGQGFKTTWLRTTLQDFTAEQAAPASYVRNLAFLGLPLTAATMEVNPTDGHEYLTQWLERGRLEWHPNEPAPYRVLFGLLGSEIGATPAPADLPAQSVAYRWPAQLPRGLAVLPADYAVVGDRGEILALGGPNKAVAYLSAGAYAGGSSYVTSDGRSAQSTPITVRNQPGLSYNIPHGNLIAWQEDGTTYAISSTYDISVDGLIALANGLEVVDRATLQQRVGVQ